MRLLARRLATAGLATALLTASTLVAVTGTADAGQHHRSHPRGYVCWGGDIPSGSYSLLGVKGDCTIPDGAVVSVSGNVWLAPRSSLDAVTLGTVHVRGNVYVGRGAILGLGCTVAGVGCKADSDVAVAGSIVAHDPLTMFLDGIKVAGDVVSYGGGPGLSATETNPAYNFAFKDNLVAGNVVFRGWRGGWSGAIRNVVGGFLDYRWMYNSNPDGNEIVANTVGHNLTCFANSPHAQLGDATQGAPPGYGPNVVGGHAYGECHTLV